MMFVYVRLVLIALAVSAITPVNAEPAPTQAQTAPSGVAAKYVSDQMVIQLRTGPGSNYKIMRSLVSGTALELLANSEQYSRVRTSDGLEGWVLSQFLQNEPTYKQQYIKTKDQISLLENQITQLKKEQESLQLTNKNLSNAKNQWESDKKKLLEETEHLRDVAAKPLELSDENASLSKKAQSQEERLNNLMDQIRELRDQTNKQWFLTGAGVILAGMLIGILIPKMRRHRHSDWASNLR